MQPNRSCFQPFGTLAQWLRGALTVALIAVPLVATSQSYPSKPVRLIVAYAPGGAADPIARLLGQKLQEAWGQAFVVENFPGAGGNIGMDMVAKAAPDGYTLGMVAASTVTINQSLYAKMPFDPEKDLVPVGLAAFDQIILVANPSMPINSIKDLIDAARAKPGVLNYASGGAGSGGHLAMELLKSMANIDIVHIPFKGAGNSLPSLISGEVGITFTSAGSVLGLVQQGKLKAIATATKTRLPSMPNLPTVGETVPGYEVTGWYGVLAPAKTPQAIIDKLNAEINRIVQQPDSRARIEKMGLLPATGTPADLAKIIHDDSITWARVIKQADIRLE